ncbi:MAG: HEPN domain-containing protein [Aigarchaeota archaeon]|nr:HEPN domain-containing protein [Candidatus Pelearchaeum maunauluense]
MRRTEDWMRMAEAALKQARDSIEDGNYWASCFFSHQAAEFSVKGFLASKGVEARGHSIYDLIVKAEELSHKIAEELKSYARNLDRHYLQSRYVNTYHVGAPVDYYRYEDAEKALREAGEVVRYFKGEVTKG